MFDDKPKHRANSHQRSFWAQPRAFLRRSAKGIHLNRACLSFGVVVVLALGTLWEANSHASGSLPGATKLSPDLQTPALISAVAGQLDPTFGSSGKILTPIGSGGDGATSVAIQSDGKIVAVGYSGNGSNEDFALARYNPNGSLDSSFGSGGKVTTPIGSSTDNAESVAIQSDGKIVVAGFSDSGSNDDFALARYNPDGSLDSSFGSGGKVTTPIGSSSEARSVAIQSDGKIIAAGDSANGLYGDFALARYNLDGSLDSSFGSGGKVTTPMGSANDDVNSVAIQSDGKIVVAGYSRNGPNDDFALARYNPDGSLDSSFGSGGKVTTPIGSSHEGAYSVAIQSDGKIVAAGYSVNGIHVIFALARYNPDGSLDSSFGSGGKVTTPIGVSSDDRAWSVAIQSDGKIIAAGSTANPSGADFAVARYNLDGSLDASFGSGGKVITPIGSAFDGANSVAIQSDGKVVAAGYGYNGSNYDFALARYLGDLSTPTPTPTPTPTANTPTGGNVTVQNGDVRATFGQVTASGSTSFAPINPSSTGAPPAGYTVLGSGPAYNINTTASYSPPVTVCLNVASIIDAAEFARVRILHGESGQLVDRTILAPDAPAPDFSTRTVCARVTSLSPFVAGLTLPAAVQFSSSNYSVTEDCTTVTVTVNRIGDTSTAASVDYFTSDVSASERRDYITAIGTLRFAAGETSKSFAVLINEDSYIEGNETFNANLRNPSGGTMGASQIATVTINDDATEPATNAIDDARNYVCQHYHDFLNRQPDASGWDFWTSEIASCSGNQACIELKRINVSAAYFLSIEFQQTGYLVERMYKVAYGDANGSSTFGGAHQLAVPYVRFNQFLPDTQQIGQGVVVNQPGWETVLESNKQAFANDFVRRPQFYSTFPTWTTPSQFVDRLNQNASNVLSATERATLIGLFGSAADISNAAVCAQALRQVAENPTLVNQEFNRAFVLMQFIGYLRRNPNDPQDTDYTGYDFWLTKLNAFDGNFVNAEMVKAFITSAEYRQRFGP